MKFDPMNAEPMGTLILDGKHKPFHALACPLQPQIKQVKKVDEGRTDFGQKQQGRSGLSITMDVLKTSC